MIRIANRGNAMGVMPDFENTQGYLEDAIKANLLVKIDLWIINGAMCSGERYPSYNISFNDILTPEKILFEAKNNAAISWCVDNGYHCFSNNGNNPTFTNKGVLISYGGNILDNSLLFFPEDEPIEKIKKMNIIGVCGNFVGAKI